MKKVRLTLVASLLPFLLTSCNNEKQLFLSNAECFFNEQSTIKNLFIDGTVDQIKNLINLDINFLIYFDDPTCVNCQKFTPIIQKYANESETLICKVDFSNYESILTTYSNIFDREDFTFPFVGVMKGNSECSRISNKKYMQTEKAFENYLDEICKNSNVYYSNKDVLKIENTREFTHILLNNDDSNAISLYSSKVKNYLENSDKNIVISNNDDLGISVSKIGPNHEIKEKTQISDETESNLIANYF